MSNYTLYYWEWTEADGWLYKEKELSPSSVTVLEKGGVMSGIDICNNEFPRRNYAANKER